MIDSHCHLNRLDLKKYDSDLAKLVHATQAAGVEVMLNVGIDLDTAQEVIDVAHRFEGVYASVGLHPSDVQGAVPTREQLLHFLNQPKVIAVGETGLDYHYNSDALESMRESFRLHIQLAKETQKPLIVHTRDAVEDTLRILQEEQAQHIGGVMHCFTESIEMARAVMEMGFYISFSGIITFRNATELQSVVEQVPLERMLIETDAPYLTPIPFRGKPNEPQYVRYVAEKVAELKKISYEDVVRTTSANFKTLFNVA